MFKLATNSSFKQKVSVNIPQGMGKTTTATLVVDFKQLSRERIEEVIEDMQLGVLGESELLREVVLGFDDVQDEDGQAMEYSDAARDKLLNISYVHTGVMSAFLDTLTTKQNRRKN